MCWNGQASATLATVGLASTAYIAYKGEERSLWVPLAYFSLMELLQAVTYTVIDLCGLPMNQVLTALGSLHITFQPFFLNAFAMHFIPKPISQKISPVVYGLCFIGSILLILKIFPFDWAGTCTVGREPFCGERLCSVSGNWHIAWEAPLNGFTWANYGYYLPVFVLPVLYGSWKFILYHLIFGPSFARLLTDNINEWPAVWCLLSIGLLLVVIKTPLRQILYTRNWLFWGAIADSDATKAIPTLTPDSDDTKMPESKVVSSSKPMPLSE
jgi:hypothetical protein